MGVAYVNFPEGGDCSGIIQGGLLGVLDFAFRSDLDPDGP
jgi:hypothetical protein